MPNPLYSQLNQNYTNNPMLKQLMEFKKSFNGNPQQMVQSMLDSGRITQEQVNKYSQQANEIYKQIKGFM